MKKCLIAMILCLSACSDEGQAQLTAAFSAVDRPHVVCTENGKVTVDITCTGEPYTPKSGQITCIDSKTNRGVTVFGVCIIRY